MKEHPEFFSSYSVMQKKNFKMSYIIITFRCVVIQEQLLNISILK